MSREERESRRERPNTGTPAVSGEAAKVLTFLEEQCCEGEMIQRLELFPSYGGSAIKKGEPLDRKDWKGNPPAPKKEELVALANRFVRVAQNKANSDGKRCKFLLNAYDERRGSSPVGGHPFSVSPNAELLDEDEDREDMQSLQLRRYREGVEDLRFSQAQNNAVVGDAFKMAMELTSKLTGFLDIFMTRYKEEWQARETAETGRLDRDLARDKQKFWLDKTGQLVDTGKQLLPLAVEKWAGKPLLGSGLHPYAVSLKSFIEGCSADQKEKLFGKWSRDAEGRPVEPLLEPGVLTIDQALVIDRVTKGEFDPAALFELLEGGKVAIRADQLSAISQFVPQQQLMPLFILFKQMEEKRQQGANPSPQQGS